MLIKDPAGGFTLILPGDLSASESSELEKERKRQQQQQQDPALMPLPDAGVDGPLDWAHLVDAAKAFEGTQSSFCCHLYYQQRKSLFFMF